MKSKKAFTLIEVMLTIMILSVCLVFVIKGLVSDLKAITAAQEYSQAIYAAESMMFQILEERSAGSRQMKGKVPLQDQYSYQLTTQPFSDTDSNLKEVELDIRWRSGGKDRDISLSTYLWDSSDSKDR